MTWIVGLTGGIGSGKTQAANAFTALGVTVIDTDIISHALTAPNGLAINAIRAAFGNDFIDGIGQMDRAKMRECIFSDPQAKSKLESILHPLIHRVVNNSILQHADEPYLVLVVPLLAESGYWIDKCNRILVIDCDAETQVKRVMQRSQLEESVVRKIIAAQASREERAAIASEIIVNESSLQQLQNQVAHLHEYYSVLAKQEGE